MLPEPGAPIHCPLNGAGWPVAVLRLEIMPSCKSVEHMAFALADTSRRFRMGVVATFHGVEVYAFPHQTTDEIARGFDLGRLAATGTDASHRAAVLAEAQAR